MHGFLLFPPADGAAEFTRAHVLAAAYCCHYNK
jgi:hypothetical protein